MHASSFTRSLPFLLLIAGCFDADPVVVSDAATADTAATDVAAADRPAADVTTVDAGRDVPAVDVPAVDVPAVDVPAVDASDVPTATDTGGSNDTGAAECIGRPAACVSGTPGGTCGDALLPPDCVAGSWRCPAGTIPVTECACIGRPPRGCTCESTGWVCPDAGL